MSPPSPPIFTSSNLPPTPRNMGSKAVNCANEWRWNKISCPKWVPPMDKLQYAKNEKGDEPRLRLAWPIPRTTFKLQANFPTSPFYPDAVVTPSLKLKHFQLHVSSKDCMFFVHPGFENTNSLIYLFLLQKDYVPITENVESVKMYQGGGEKKRNPS